MKQILTVTLITTVLVACGAPDPAARAISRPVAGNARAVAVLDTVVAATQDADGVSAPIQQATVSTKLMGTVVEVLVREGDVVNAGAPLVRIDARDVDAKGAQAAASVAAAEAAQANAAVQLKRVRALYADSAAPKAMLDAAESGSAQADAAVRAARAAATEVASVRDYATVKAPFSGIVSKRFVDAGAFASPGAPLIQVQDISRLRLAVSATPSAARGARRGASLDATVDGAAVKATVEGVVPSLAGGVYTINVIVENPAGRLPAGGSATVQLPAGTRRALVVPAAAIVMNGDLVGVRVRVGTSDDLRWVKVGRTMGSYTEVLAGLRAGDQVLVPTGTGS